MKSPKLETIITKRSFVGNFEASLIFFVCATMGFLPRSLLKMTKVWWRKSTKVFESNCNFQRENGPFLARRSFFFLAWVGVTGCCLLDRPTDGHAQFLDTCHLLFFLQRPNWDLLLIKRNSHRPSSRFCKYFILLLQKKSLQEKNSN